MHFHLSDRAQPFASRKEAPTLQQTPTPLDDTITAVSISSHALGFMDARVMFLELLISGLPKSDERLRLIKAIERMDAPAMHMPIGQLHERARALLARQN